MANQKQGEIQTWDTIRIPLTSTQTARIVDVAADPTCGIVGIGVVGQMIVGKARAGAKDQRLVNFIPENITNPNVTTYATQPLHYINKRPGFATFSTPNSGKLGTAIHMWLGNSNALMSAFTVSGNSTIYNGTSSQGAITGVTNDISETIIAGVANIAMISSDNTGWFQPAAGALTKISDSDFPGNASKTMVGGFIHVNERAHCLTSDGLIYSSDVSSLSSWTATANIATNMSPDMGVGLARYKNYIIAFGQESIEFFQDVGEVNGSPLQRVEQAFVKIGALNANAICAVEDTIFWAATSDKGGIAIFMLQDLNPIKVSTGNIDLQLSQVASSGINLTTCKIRGKTLIFVNSTQSSPAATFVYSVEEKVWHEWNSQTILWTRMTGQPGGQYPVYTLSDQTTSGKIYVINPNSPVYQDDGFTYVSTVQTDRYDASNENYKRCSKAKIIGDRQASTSMLTISWSDDDYQTYKGAVQVDLSLPRAYVANLGGFRRRSFKLDHISATPCRLQALELDLSQGIH